MRNRRGESRLCLLQRRSLLLLQFEDQLSVSVLTELLLELDLLMAAASASSSSSSSPWKYDVFINFRGEDTRRSFVSHLYEALNEKTIHTFIDAEGLRKGNDLSQLLTAIQDSRVSIVVFSQKYASSTWCLKELVKILECMDRKEQMVVPVFYEVDPSDVRKAFAEHEGHSNTDMEEVRRWRSALSRATELSGWVSKNCENDVKLIKEIVNDIFQKLIRTSSSKDDNLVEMDSRMHEMDLLLQPSPEMDDVRVVGIWGMGGIGKTTIARAVYEKIACQYEACCILYNVKEGFSTCDAVHMREKLLSGILNEKVQSSGTLDQGYRMILRKLQMKKVLIVLDDVDNVFQIETLIGKQRSFGGGSRIIITTRDKLVLSPADAIYSPKVLSGDGALELFSQYAFRTKQPKRDYDNLSTRAVRYAQGLPLALKVLGAFLYDKSVQEWEDVLKKLKKIPHRGIHDVLRTSFDGLDDSEKAIFLDIACFFKGAEKDNATMVLDSCGFYPHTGLRVLIDRALITVSSEILEMHDLLEEMGREIVHQESIKEPGKRSRLWNYEDVHHVLTQNTATEAVESIILDLSFSKPKVVYFSSEAFVKMTKLRLLKIHGHNGYSCENLKFLLHELRSLVWKHFPLKSLPSNFIAKNLVELDMQNSLIEHLWEGAKETAIDTRAFTKYNLHAPDFTSLETEEIARWKATAEEEAAVGTGVEQEFVAQLKSIETNFNLMMECRENAGESLLSLSKPANHVAPPVFLRFTEDHNHQAIISAGSRLSSQQFGFTWTLKLCHIFNNGRPKRQMNSEDDDFFDALISALLRNSLGLW
ncbi:TMV resistance protein N-like [Pyrus x bretschneideri]|uniref:TMV resistance protein N-like n=1 Tax=Pyrus x bretschneideri TaxID=225117 RepID=UPI00203058DE|nr:TMV resistance protein N-like [Pyrus x bretschneideri]